MSERIRLPLRTRLAMLLRLLAVQGSWNYETMVGTGIGFCLEPALRFLPGGTAGERYRAALARQCEYFNAHPYLCAIAVGALARAELDGEPSERIERFRTALCGPLGALGDRLVWASFLPLSSLTALLAFGLGAGPLAVTLTFLVVYNSGHMALRIWGLETGLRRGLSVAQALAAPALQRAPMRLGQLAAGLAGMALPLALQRLIGPGRALLGVVLLGVLATGLLLARLRGRVEGWKAAVLVLGGFVLLGVLA
jgi:PTS system mannose-specific IID component